MRTRRAVAKLNWASPKKAAETVMIKSHPPERWMSGLSRTPGKRVYGESRTAGSNPALSAKDNAE